MREAKYIWELGPDYNSTRENRGIVKGKVLHEIDMWHL